MLSRRIDLTTELSIEDVKRLEDRIMDAMLATREPNYFFPPSRLLLKGAADEAREEAERRRLNYVIVAYEPERRSEAIEAMRCPFIDAISFTLDTVELVNRSVLHVARINKKAIEVRFLGDLAGIKGLLKARHRLTVSYVPIYFGSGARSKEERVDPYALAGFFRRTLKYDLFKRSVESQRELLMRNLRRLEGLELAPGVWSMKNLLRDTVTRNGAGRSAEKKDEGGDRRVNGC